MGAIGNQVLGVIFLVVAAAQVALGFYAWGFPYDHEKYRSQAPRPIVWTHRLLGYLYVAIYIYLMSIMVPRMWTYQIELPARTVAHLILGISIGGLLLVKLSIVRIFRYLEAQLVPFLGVLLFICTLVLVGLALPFTFREAYLSQTALQGDMLNAERLERVREQLPKTGLEDKNALDELASASGILAGRQVLINKCTQCHDLRTALARPRTPESWRQTVRRMANRSTILNPISDTEQWQVMAYLIAISPTLQRTLRMKRDLDEKTATSQQAIMSVGKTMQEQGMAMTDDFDLDAARELFQTRCSQCHSPVLVEGKPPASSDAALQLVTRMVRNGLQATDMELATIVRYLTVTYAQENGSKGAEALPQNPDRAPAATQAPAQTNAKPAQVAQAQSQPAEDKPVSEVVLMQPFDSELRFAEEQLTLKAGTRVKFIFDNVSSQTHNFVILRDAKAIDEVVGAALGASATGFVPDHPAILASVKATPAGGRGEAVIDVPPPGEYAYVCLMPAHGFTMRGTLRAVE